MNQNSFQLGELDTKPLRPIAEQIAAINKSIADWHTSYADVSAYRAELDAAFHKAAAALRSMPSRETVRAALDAKAAVDQMNSLLQAGGLPSPEHCDAVHRGRFPNANGLAVELCDAICKALEKFHTASFAEDARHAESLGLERLESARTKQIAEFRVLAMSKRYQAASFFAGEILK